MKKFWFNLMACGAALGFTGCGTVSHVTPTAGKEVDLRPYERVIVTDFTDGVSETAKPSVRDRKKAELAIASKAFPDRIAIELGALKAFQEVTRTGTPDAKTLVISGTITRYEEGSSTMRLMIGMGAGSSYFDAVVDLKDGTNSEVLATQKVDKNSWGGGGALAASQTPEAFMREGAKKLAPEISSLKLTGKLPVQKQTSAAKAH
jgi:Domain of unknown function (DUF4410)